MKHRMTFIQLCIINISFSKLVYSVLLNILFSFITESSVIKLRGKIRCLNNNQFVGGSSADETEHFALAL